MENQGAEKRFFSCEKCSYTTKYKSNLTRHMVKHEREAELSRLAALKCDVCGQVFASKYNCDRHKKSKCSKNQLVADFASQPAVFASQPAVFASQPADFASQPADFASQPPCGVISQRISHSEDTESVSSGTGFSCPSCYKVFSRESRMNEHISKCKQIQSPLECPKCHVILSCSASKCKHIKRCKVVPNVPVATSIINATNYYNTTNNIQNNINNNNNNININGLGKENLTYLSLDFLAKQAIRSGSQGAIECIKAIHFNPEYPENQNIRLLANDDIDDHFIAVYDEEKWDIRDFACTVGDVLQHVCIMLKDRVGQRDFQKKYEDHWMTICDRLNKLTRASNPHDFYTIMRTLKLLLRDLDKVQV